MVRIGDKLEDIVLPSSSGGLFNVSDLLESGKTVVLVFYLLDFSGA